VWKVNGQIVNKVVCSNWFQLTNRFDLSFPCAGDPKREEQQMISQSPTTNSGDVQLRRRVDGTDRLKAKLKERASILKGRESDGAVATRPKRPLEEMRGASDTSLFVSNAVTNLETESGKEQPTMLRDRDPERALSPRRSEKDKDKERNLKRFSCCKYFWKTFF
jgi:hypothetical protein